MIDTIFEKKIKYIVAYYSRSNNFDFHYELIKVDSDNFNVKLNNSDFAFIVNETLDIPTTAKITIKSADNFLTTSKEEFEKYKKSEQEKFSGYLNIKTENYGTTFIPYIIKLLIVTPF